MSGGQAAFVWLFTVTSLGVWLMTLAWTLKQGKRWVFYSSLFVSITIFWCLSESLAIRLGKYEYATFPHWLVLGGGGAPNTSDVALRALMGFLHLFFNDAELKITNCWPAQQSWNVPIPVIALETALLFSFIRASQLWLRRTGFRTALAAAGISGLLMINVMAVLDPVVSTTQWCGGAPAPPFHGLDLGIWHWFTNEFHIGYWFGVPLVNYVAWFLTAAIFTAVVQLDDDGPRGVIAWFYRRFGVFGPLAIAIFAFVCLLPIKIAVDKLLMYGQVHLLASPSFDPRLWQYGVVGGLDAVGLILVAAFGQFRRHAKVELAAAYAQLVVFAFCLCALAHTWDTRIATVWAVTFVIASLTIVWPLFYKTGVGTERPLVEMEGLPGAR